MIWCPFSRDTNQGLANTTVFALEMRPHTFYMDPMRQNSLRQLLKKAHLRDFQLSCSSNKVVKSVLVSLFVCLIAIKAQKLRSLAHAAIFHGVSCSGTGTVVIFAGPCRWNVISLLVFWWGERAYHDFIFGKRFLTTGPWDVATCVGPQDGKWNVALMNRFEMRTAIIFIEK